MRHLAFGGRQSGRTTLLVNEIAKDMELHDKDVFVVAGRFCIAMMVRRALSEINKSYASRVKCISVDSINQTRGTDLRNIYFEHTAYEMANSKQLLEIYTIEDMKSAYIWGAP